MIQGIPELLTGNIPGGDTTIGFLNGRWAPGATYTDKILLFANQIYGR